MTVYTETELSRSTAALLERACSQGEVRIKRPDGREFVLRPAEPSSPLDVPGVESNLTLADILDAIRDGRDRPRPPLDVGFVAVDPPLTADEIVSLVREGRERG